MALEFDQDLFIQRSLECVGLSNCSAQVPMQSDCMKVCDFSRREQQQWQSSSSSFCARASSLSEALSCNCTALSLTSGICNDPDDAADNSDVRPWMSFDGATVDEHQATMATIAHAVTSSSAPAHIRFFINDTCADFRLIVYPRNSVASLYLRQGAPPTLDTYDYTSQQLYTHIDVCASELVNPYGTWFVMVLPGNSLQSIVEFDLQLTRTVAPVAIAATCTVPADLQSTHKCLSDSVVYEGACEDAEQNPLEKNLFVYEFSQCVTVSLSLLSFYCDADIYAGLENPVPDIGASTVISYLVGNDSVVMNACPTDGDGTGRLYILVDCWSVSLDRAIHPFSLFLTSQPNLIVNTRIDKYPAASGFWLVGMLRVVTNNDMQSPWIDPGGYGSTWITCEDHLYE
jgi:hypothetical protein